MEGKRRVHPEAVQQEALRQLLLGASAGQVGRRLGVRASQVSTWARIGGVQIQYRGDLSRLVNEDLPKVQGRRLSLQGRIQIQVGLVLDKSFRQIALGLGVATSTVSRDVERNGGRDGYRADIAHLDTMQRRKRPRGLKIDDPEIRRQVIEGLNKRWSPQQIANTVTDEDGSTMISHETIYQALYVQGKGALRQELKVHKALRSGRKQRVPQSQLPPSSRSWLEGHELSTRPAEAADRAVPGHWEGDLIIGTDMKSALITLVERSTRFVLIRRLGTEHTSQKVTGELIDMVSTIPQELRQTVTWDQGSEMSQHARFTMATNTKVYFCDPHSPWQRGTNENTNGLIRDFFPKSTNFATITDEEVHEAQELLNGRPRQTLDWATPAERLNALLTRVALAS